MVNPFFDHPILNSPYTYPARHWELDDQGQPTQRLVEHRRRAEFITPIPKPRKRKGSEAQQQLIFDEGKGLSTREQQYERTATMINAVRQQEVAPYAGRAGRAFLEHLANANNDANPELLRLALKLATGAGKTTVMAMLIAWQTINAVRRPNSKNFTRGFLIVAPGLTIRDRLRVLQPNDPDSYYASRLGDEVMKVFRVR
jgi:type III restriction enzyme